MPGAMRECIDALLNRAVDDQVFPGAVWAVGDAGGTLATGACGLLDPDRPAGRMRLDTLFDLASLTKIISVWAGVGALWEDGRLDLDVPLVYYFPELAGFQLAMVTPRHLLTHTAGVPLRANLRSLYGTDRRAVKRGILQERLHRRPGEAVEYTDRAALILGFLIERITGHGLDKFSRTQVWSPLGMTTTGFGPLPAELAGRCAPTEWDDTAGRHLRGTPHDYSARLLRVCGSAGTFSVVGDLAAFLTYLLAPGQARRRPGFGPAWVTESLRVQTGQLEPSRGLFWHPAPGGTPGEDVWAHFGFTGTAMWVSPRLGRWAVLLTNKLYYTRDSRPIFEVRDLFTSLTFDRSVTPQVA